MLAFAPLDAKGLLTALKAVGEPTRLRILSLLAGDGHGLRHIPVRGGKVQVCRVHGGLAVGRDSDDDIRGWLARQHKLVAVGRAARATPPASQRLRDVPAAAPAHPARG